MMRSLILKLGSIILLLNLFACYSKTVNESTKYELLNHSNLIYTDSVNEDISINHYKLSSHENMAVVNNRYIERNFMSSLLSDRFWEISNDFDVVEIFYEQDTIFLDTYIRSCYLSYMYSERQKKQTDSISIHYLNKSHLAKLKKALDSLEIDNKFLFETRYNYTSIKSYENNRFIIIIYLLKENIIKNETRIKIHSYGLYKGRKFSNIGKLLE